MPSLFLRVLVALKKIMHLQWGYRSLLEGQVLEIADWQWVEIPKWQWWCSQVPSSNLAVGAIDNAPSSPTTTTTILVRPRSPLLGSFWLNTMPWRHLERPWAILWLGDNPLKLSCTIFKATFFNYKIKDHMYSENSYGIRWHELRMVTTEGMNSLAS